MIYTPAWIEMVTAEIVATTPHSQEAKAAERILRALADSGAALTDAME